MIIVLVIFGIIFISYVALVIYFFIQTRGIPGVLNDEIDLVARKSMKRTTKEAIE